MAPAPQPEESARTRALLGSVARFFQHPTVSILIATLFTILGGIFFVLGLAWIVNADPDSARTWVFFSLGIVFLAGGLTALALLKLKSRGDASRRRRRRQPRPRPSGRVFTGVIETSPRPWTTAESQASYPAPPTYAEAVGHPQVLPVRSPHRASIPPPYRH
uniref:Integral membrane protein n=1 Tax=Steinernema glaseri TaxID=37863 RepID=A0A1I7ZSY2_9BILA